MTREFNKQRRDDMRPSSRKPSSGRHGDERPARPARPRLNRETVDRAWESGAQQQHADYRPRSSNGASPHRHTNQRPEYSSSQSSRGRDRSYGNRQDQRPRSRPLSTDRRASDHPRFQDRERRNYSDEPNGTGTRPNFQNRERGNDSDRPNRTGTRPPFQNRERSSPIGPNGTRARPRFRDDASPRGRGQQFRERDQYRDSQQQDGDYRAHSSRGPAPDTRRSYRPEQHERFSRDGQAHDTRPRPGPDRPPTHRDGTSRPRNREQFEGDYEHLNNDAPPRPRHTAERSPRRNRERNETPERHVTRLSDGHVLKGSRPAQRKNAQFWMEVAEDREELLDQVHTAPTEAEDTKQPLDHVHVSSTEAENEEGKTEDTKVVKAMPKRKRRVVATGAVVREKKATKGKPRTAGS